MFPEWVHYVYSVENKGYSSLLRSHVVNWDAVELTLQKISIFKKHIFLKAVKIILKLCKPAVRIVDLEGTLKTCLIKNLNL